MDEVEFHSVELIFKDDQTDLELEFGALTLYNDTREYKIDTTQVYRTFEAGITTVNVVFEEDRDMFECKYDLTPSDLFKDDAKVMMFYLTEVDPESVVLYIEMNGVKKSMNVEQD